MTESPQLGGRFRVKFETERFKESLDMSKEKLLVTNQTCSEFTSMESDEEEGSERLKEVLLLRRFSMGEQSRTEASPSIPI